MARTYSKILTDLNNQFQIITSPEATAALTPTEWQHRQALHPAADATVHRGKKGRQSGGNTTLKGLVHASLHAMPGRRRA